MRKLSALLIFAKAPIIGLVKTRLKKNTDLSDEDILELYRAFLKDILATAQQKDSETVYLSFYPAKEKKVMVELVKEYSSITGEFKDLRLLRQRGEDFDERFTNAVSDVLKNHSHVVVIGSDSPHIQRKTIEEAFDLLKRNDGMVLGPSKEGGVYLVGVSKPLDFTHIFTEGIELDNLVKLAKRHRMPLVLLEELTDLDVAEDLTTFICNIAAMEYASSFGSFSLPENTVRTIRGIGLCVESHEGGERGRRIVKR